MNSKQSERYSTISNLLPAIYYVGFLGIFVLTSLFPVSSRAQEAAPAPNPATGATMTGDPPYSTHEMVREDVGVATGGLHVSIPILSLPGKGGQTFSLEWTQDSHNIILQEYDVADGWNYSLGGSGAGALNPYDYITWLVSPDIYGYVTIPHLRAAWLFMGDYCLDQEQACVNYPLFCNSSFVFRDAHGTSYTFSHANEGYLPLARDCSYTPTGIGGQDIHTNAVGTSDQSGGVRLDASNPNDLVVWTKDGTAYHFPAIQTWPSNQINSGPEILQYYYDNDFVSIIDPNGNTITKSGSTITDSTGRTITASNSATGSNVSWTDSNGNSQSFAAALGGTPGPSVTTHATNCQFNNQYQSSNQTQGYLYNGDIGNLGNYATGMTLSFPGGAVYILQLDQLGKITKISYPSGGYTRYDYADYDPEFHLAYLTCYAADYYEVSAKHLCSSTAGSCTGNNPEVTTTYTPVASPVDGNNLNMNVVDPLNNLTYYYFGEYAEQGSPSVFSNPRETQRQLYSGQSTLVRTVNTAWNGTADDAAPTQVTTVYNDVSPSISSYVSTTYDTSSGCVTDNPKEIDEYDFTGTLIRKTNYVWQLGGNYTCTVGHILDRVQSKTITDAATGHYTTTSYAYDLVGNPLTLTISGTSATSMETQYKYNTDGDRNKGTDPKSNNTTYSYTSPWYDSKCAQGAASSGKPSSITNALNQTTTFKYYSCTGLLATATDPNSQTTTYTYDALGRMTNVAYPDKGNISKTYVDVAPESVTTTVAITSSLNSMTKSLLDGLGRESESQLTTDPAGTDYKDTTYDALERVASVSNPYRTTSDPTYGLTQYVYDALGRTCVVVRPDGAVVTSCPSAAPAGDVFTTYAGACTTVTDEAGKTRESCVDGLGRMRSVLEDPGTSPHLNYVTDYTYDGFNNLTGVTQNGGRSRTFTYDGMSRLTKAVNPESGTIQYSYPSGSTLCSEDASAVCTRTAPSPNQASTGTATVTTTYTYDALNRLTGKNYSDTYTSNPATASATYGYDATVLTGCTSTPPTLTDSYPVGRRTAMCDGSGATSWSHDKMGRPLSEDRDIDGQTQTTSYTYNLDGSLYTLTYPGTAKIITYAPAGAGLPTAAQDTADSINYVESATYAPFGSLASMVNGKTTSFTGINVANTYNNRLQALQTYVTTATISGTTQNQLDALTCPTTAATIMNRVYNFAPGTNNGNVQAITNCLANSGNGNRSQSFTYDSLNRITSGQSAGTAWGENFTIDAWGNLYSRTGITGKTYYEPLSVTALTNNQLSGFTYDAAGNLITNSPSTYKYDGENRLSTTGGYNYYYDGDGNRVGKSNGSTGTLYWRGPTGDPISESSLTGTSQEEYIFFGGTRVARRDVSGSAVHYHFSDHLGTHAMVENATGSSCEQDIDYYPYGGVVYDYCGTVQQHYRFTGKERDTESGLDYFGARYYASSMGRWMSPDWSAKEDPVPYAKLDNPQSLNLYGYVLNNPLSQKDDDGHEIIYADGLKNGQLVRDSVTAILANPNTSSYLSGYVGPNAPNLIIQSGDLGPPTVTTLPNGQTLTTTVQGNTAPDIQTTQMNNDPPQTTLTGATITIDNNTSKGDTPGVMIHESVHAGEAQKNPAQFNKDAKAERGQPHDSRPQEQRANAVRAANEKQIKQQIKQIEKDRKKDQQ
ncbi:MAG: RHS repeat-associated core domain-containing protein [Candidatus Sulfotelmatobacter sp.]